MHHALLLPVTEALVKNRNKNNKNNNRKTEQQEQGQEQGQEKKQEQEQQEIQACIQSLQILCKDLPEYNTWYKYEDLLLRQKEGKAELGTLRELRDKIRGDRYCFILFYFLSVRSPLCLAICKRLYKY